MLPADVIMFGTLVWDGSVQCWNEFVSAHPIIVPALVSEFAAVATPVDKIERANALVSATATIDWTELW